MSLTLMLQLNGFRSNQTAIRPANCLELFQQRAVELIAPDLLIAEAANVFWKHALRDTLTAQAAQSNLHDLLFIQLPLVPAAVLAVRGLDLALTYRRSAYDSLYLALERGCDLVTSDERLFNAIGIQFPQIRLLHHLAL